MHIVAQAKKKGLYFSRDGRVPCTSVNRKTMLPRRTAQPKQLPQFTPDFDIMDECVYLGSGQPNSILRRTAEAIQKFDFCDTPWTVCVRC